jgi:O-antigen ligase
MSLTLLLAGLTVEFGVARQDMVVPAGLLAGLIAVPIILRKPIAGVFLVFAAAVVVETDKLTFGLSVTSSIPIFRDIGPFFVNPAELILVVTAAGWLLRSRDKLARRPIPLFVPFTVFMAAVAFGVVHGMLTHGDLKIALWTVRPLAYFYIAYLLTFQLVRDRRQVTALLWVFILGVALKGAIGWWRYYVDLGGSLAGLSNVVGMNSVMAHEESFFYAGLMLLAVVQILYGAPRGQRIATLLATPLVLLPFMANQRRAGVLALIVALPLLCVMTLSLLPKRRHILIGGLVLAGAFLPFYVGASWGTQSLVSEPVQAMKSGVTPDTRDQLSNQYRVIEDYDLTYTAKHNPLIGIGYGKEMTQAKTLPNISAQFSWFKIAPHNSILWILMTLGLVGFIAFWYFLGSLIIRMLQTARQLPRPGDRGIVAFALVMLASLLVFAMLDQGFFSMRTMIFVGVLMGVVFALPHLQAKAEETIPTGEGDDD